MIRYQAMTSVVDLVSSTCFKQGQWLAVSILGPESTVFHLQSRMLSKQDTCRTSYETKPPEFLYTWGGSGQYLVLASWGNHTLHPHPNDKDNLGHR